MGLTWNASSDNASVSSYKVYRSTTDGFTPGAGTKIANVTSGTSYNDTSAPVGAQFYKVVAVDPSNNMSDPSNQATVTVPDTTAPSQPTGLGAAVTASNVKLDWTASTDAVGVTDYHVYRGTTSGFTPNGASQIADVTTGTTYTDSGLANGTYYYKVTALDAATNESGAAGPAAAVISPPGQAQTVVLTPTEDVMANFTAPTTNQNTGSNALQLAARVNGPSPQESFLKFALPSAPAGTTLTSATLKMTTSSDPTSTSTDPTDFKVLSDNSWGENTLTWNNRPTGAGTLFATMPPVATVSTATTFSGDVSCPARGAGRAGDPADEQCRDEPERHGQHSHLLPRGRDGQPSHADAQLHPVTG